MCLCKFYSNCSSRTGRVPCIFWLNKHSLKTNINFPVHFHLNVHIQSLPVHHSGPMSLLDNVLVHIFVQRLFRRTREHIKYVNDDFPWRCFTIKPTLMLWIYNSHIFNVVASGVYVILFANTSCSAYAEHIPAHMIT